MKISTILDNIDAGTIALPEFQRGYVWSREQVKRLMTSLYKRHPVGSLLVWQTKRDTTKARGQAELKDTVDMLLDGQQRITSVYGIIRGKAPRFFDGDSRAFTDLYFDIIDEVFEFYGPLKMEGKANWVSVTDLMQKGIGPYVAKFGQLSNEQISIESFIERLNLITGIKDIDIHVDLITGEDKTTDIVVDIFNEVNSGGTKLSKGDLALAKICGSWPEARDVLKAKLEKWEKAGFHFKMDWFLRCINSILTGEAKFSALDGVGTAEFEKGIGLAERSVDKLLNTISSRLGLDHSRVLGSKYSFPLMCRYVVQNNMTLGSHRERDRLLYWYVHTILWGRYAGSTESVLDKDLAVLEQSENPIDGLISELRQNRGDLTLYPSDFKGYSRGARFYPMLYLLTRVWNARDWDSGDALHNHLLGNLSGLQLHHIFPKDFLYDGDYTRDKVNALANMTFLTQEANLKISNKPPKQYFTDIESRHPGILKSHWIPMSPKLWERENYDEFLVERQKLLAEAANSFLNSLKEGKIEESLDKVDFTVNREKPLYQIIPSIEDAEEEQMLKDVQSWIKDKGIAEGEWGLEVTGQDGEPIAIFDLAWPDGVQKYLTQPVALLIDEEEDVKMAANKAGFRYFTNPNEFKKYIREEVLKEKENVLQN